MAKQFSIKRDSSYAGEHYNATNVRAIELRVWRISSDKYYTGEIKTKKGNMILLLGAHYTLGNILKAADDFINEYSEKIKEILALEKVC